MSFLNRVRRSVATGSLLSLAAVAMAHATEPAPTGLRVRLETQRPSSYISELATILYTLRNDSPEDVWVLYWQTPLRGIWGDLFEVRLDGQTVDYTGLIVEWAAPEESDFIRIPAGGEVSVTVDLSAAYDMSRGGEYSVEYRVPSYENMLIKSASGAALLTRLNSDPVTFWVDRNEAAQPRPAISRFDDFQELIPLVSPTVTPGFVGCSTSRQMTINFTLVSAETISNQARGHLNASTDEAGYADKDYRTWFGCYDVNRYAAVKRKFDAISGALSTQSLTFYCNDSDALCKQTNAFAYAERYNPYHMHLCKRFWGLPILSIDSKIGTLIHETSHFAVVADTLDINPSNVKNCKLIANGSPDSAINYACSYQYFAESRPSTESGSVAPTITRTAMPGLPGNGTYVYEELRFSNEDCDPIVRIETRLVSAPPGNWQEFDTENPKLADGTWKSGLFLLRYWCHFEGHGRLGPIIIEHVLVDAGGRRSKPKRVWQYCYN
jgi:peptidyl-Lys metalloendopeptidase